MTNNNYQGLIEVLGAYQCLDCGTIGSCECKQLHNCQLAPILIGDVLEKMSKEVVSWPAFEKMVGLWEPLGFTKSLQEVAEMWENNCTCPYDCPLERTANEMPLTPEAKSLTDFLTSIFL